MVNSFAQTNMGPAKIGHCSPAALGTAGSFAGGARNRSSGDDRRKNGELGRAGVRQLPLASGGQRDEQAPNSPNVAVDGTSGRV